MIAAATDRRQIRPVCTCGRAVEGCIPVRRGSPTRYWLPVPLERRYGGRWMAATDFPVPAVPGPAPTRACVRQIGSIAVPVSASRLQQLGRREAARLARLRAPQRQPEAGLAPAAQPRLPLGALVGHLAEAHS